MKCVSELLYADGFPHNTSCILGRWGRLKGENISERIGWPFLKGERFRYS